jgi:hypothetical protein
MVAPVVDNNQFFNPVFTMREDEFAENVVTAFTLHGQDEELTALLDSYGITFPEDRDPKKISLFLQKINDCVEQINKVIPKELKSEHTEQNPILAWNPDLLKAFLQLGYAFSFFAMFCRQKKMPDPTGLQSLPEQERFEAYTKMLKTSSQSVQDTLSQSFQVLMRDCKLFSFNFERRVTCLPNDLSKIGGLEGLQIGNTKIMSVSKKIASHPTIHTFTLGDNKITSLPVEIWHEHLYFLSLYRNQLHSLPVPTHDKCRVWTLLISQNPLSVFPEAIRHLKGLRELACGSCEFKELPHWIGELSELKKLSLQENDLETLPDEMSGLKLLEELDIQCNPRVRLPDTMAQLKSLKQIRVSRDFTLPSWLELAKIEDRYEKGDRVIVLKKTP